MNPGIMQGRLSPPDPRRLQAFPWAGWRQEFNHAARLGFPFIEWLFEEERFEENPLWTAEGRRAIRRAVDETGVAVRSVCADYFMPRPLHRLSRGAGPEVLARLAASAGEVGASVILLPVLEESAIESPEEVPLLAAALRSVASACERAGVSVGLETELPADEYAALIDSIGLPFVGAYYDTGNAAAKGFRGEEDLAALGRRLLGLHLKDRIRGGGSVP